MSWAEFKECYNVNDSYQFKWRQIKHAIPLRWKTIISENITDFLASKNSMHEQHILFGSRNIPLTQLTSKLISVILIRTTKT